ncbi:hypothetical protein Taro_017550 [Colocasia esculenta]|uniref:Uncharacterized protein n=1 Tax=Colocasia esculenta TaxID=4460 RepID=A0A843UZN9_COLES|nr:hypothetical protein [Colocasia esculenta]
MSTRRKMVSARQRKPSEEAGDTSRATAERRSKHMADRTPEVHVPENLDLCRVAGIFKKIMQPRYVNFASLEDMFEGLEDLAGDTVSLKPRCAYNLATAKRMGYKMVEGRVTRTLKGQEAAEEDEDSEEEDISEEEEESEENMDISGGNEDVPYIPSEPDIQSASQVPLSQDMKDFISEQLLQCQTRITQHINTQFGELNQHLDQLKQHVDTRMDAIEQSHGHLQRHLDGMDYGLMHLRDDFQHLQNFYNPPYPTDDNFSNLTSHGPYRPTPPRDDNP